MDWDEMARPWLEAAPDLEAAFVEVFDALFDAANLKTGETILDVGCGTGPTLLRAAEAVGDTGRVVGIDIAPPLLERAAERVPETVDLIVGDAGTFAYQAGRFDAIVANFGVMFFADNAEAFANLRRSVRPGGRLAATVWAKPSENPWFSMPRGIVDGFVRDVPRPDPDGPGPMRFGDPDGLREILIGAGWAPDIRSLDVYLYPPGAAARVAELHMKVTVGMMLKGVDVADAALGKIRDAVAEACQSYDIDGQISVPAKIHVVTATAV